MSPRLMKKSLEDYIGMARERYSRRTGINGVEFLSNFKILKF
jgi:hypothetical protein